MKSKNELFLEAVDYLIDEGLAADQADVSKQAGLGPNLISRVKNGKVKNVSDVSIRALASHFKLNMDFFRGKSERITRFTQSSHEDYHTLDQSFMYEKAIKNIIAPVYDKQITLLEKQVADKDEQIERLKKESDDKDELIKMLRARVQELEAKNNDETLKKYPFQMGVSEQTEKEIKRV